MQIINTARRDSLSRLCLDFLGPVRRAVCGCCCSEAIDGRETKGETQQKRDRRPMGFVPPPVTGCIAGNTIATCSYFSNLISPLHFHTVSSKAIHPVSFRGSSSPPLPPCVILSPSPPLFLLCHHKTTASASRMSISTTTKHYYRGTHLRPN